MFSNIFKNAKCLPSRAFSTGKCFCIDIVCITIFFSAERLIERERDGVKINIFLTKLLLCDLALPSISLRTLSVRSGAWLMSFKFSKCDAHSMLCIRSVIIEYIRDL